MDPLFFASPKLHSDHRDHLLQMKMKMIFIFIDDSILISVRLSLTRIYYTWQTSREVIHITHK